MTTCVISRLVNQADKASRSAVIVLNVRVSLRGWPFGPGVRQQTATVFLCTSRPATCVYRISMGVAPWHAGRDNTAMKMPFLRDSGVRASQPRLGTPMLWAFQPPGPSVEETSGTREGATLMLAVARDGTRFSCGAV